jgi:hypothetical protein
MHISIFTRQVLSLQAGSCAKKVNDFKVKDRLPAPKCDKRTVPLSHFALTEAGFGGKLILLYEAVVSLIRGNIQQTFSFHSGWFQQYPG